MAEASYQSGHTKTQSGPVGRMKIHRGLVTEEYPDLLLPPNALPSIDVKVVSSRMKLPRASLIALTQLDEDPVFTLAVFSRASNGELWRMEKDSASLLKLDQRLKQCPAFTARTPDRSLFHGHSPAKLDCRREALDQYLDELLNTPLDTATAEELCRYLSTNTLPPYADEVGFAYRPTGDIVHSIPENRCALTGYLTKKGKNFGGWKARYFVLDGLQLRYFESPGGTYLGAIRLQNAQIGKQPQGHDGNSTEKTANDGDFDDQYRHAFLILEQKKKDSNHFIKHVLCAESDVERDMWVDGLKGIDQPEANDEAQGSKPNSLDRPTAGAPENASAGGDAPQNVQQKVISGPRDPQIISDSTAWGNKAAPAPITSTHDEKKQRKRSFFGFGARSRNSSDGHDGAFGGTESGISPTPVQSAYLNSTRPVFGSPLAEAVRFNAPHDVRVPVPAVVYRCIEYLESRNAILEEGIFRLSGSNIVIKQLRERFDTEGDINLVTDEQYYDIHAVASLLKLYLRELPTSILTRDLHFEFLSITEMTDRERKLAALKVLVLKLPQANLTLLKYLIAFLIRIINKADINKMTIRNVGIVFSPTLHVPAPVFAIFLSSYEAIFGVDPEEYELPVLAQSLDANAPTVDRSQRGAGLANDARTRSTEL
ncbi:GTPase-activating protein BEM3 [Escovopsis weberi]|uniref:GTPase-activating protein BEM3 n=1 Tax=Escovopsis weberi TaxID=150374 RepID=A0A0M9VVJ7_ESCWE|nr:GTPase-activating protein BEM3 [Escovopsis weberi]